MHTGPLEMYNRFDCLKCELRRRASGRRWRKRAILVCILAAAGAAVEDGTLPATQTSLGRVVHAS